MKKCIFSILLFITGSILMKAQTPVIIKSNGNVGISTNDPLSKLSVGGNGESYSTIYSKYQGSSGYGVHGITDSLGAGVYGQSTLTGTGTGHGVYGSAECNGCNGVKGQATGSFGSAIYGAGFNGSNGIYGTSSDVGVWGNTSGSYGKGVYGRSNLVGVGTSYGGYFISQSTIAYGTLSYAAGVGNNYAVYGKAENGIKNWAGYFEGDGYFSKNVGIGTFENDYPLTIRRSLPNNPEGALLHSEVTGTIGNHTIAVRGISIPTSSHGIGGKFEGKLNGVWGVIINSAAQTNSSVKGTNTNSTGSLNIGVHGISNGSSFEHRGVYGESSSSGQSYGTFGRAYGSNENYGVFGWAHLNGITKYGVYGLAEGNGTNYGVYGKANGGSVNWAGHFLGRGFFSENVGIGAITPADLLHLKGSQAALRVENPGGNYGKFQMNNINELNIVNESANAIRFISGNVEHMFISGNGNVGIGTVSLIPLTVDDGSDASLAGGGYIMTNSPSSTNIVIDDNEIMARNNGVASTLFLQAQGGRIGIGSSSANSTVHIKHPVKTTGNADAGLRLENAVSNDTWIMYVRSSGGDGDLLLYSDDGGPTNWVGEFDATSGTYSATSDARLKKNFEKIEGVLPKLNLLQAKKYHFKTQDDSAQKYIGFIAQEVEKVFPELTSYDEEADLYHLNYDGFAVLSIQAIKELQLENQALESRLSDLELKFEKQQKLMEQLLITITPENKPTH